jgi:ABC-type transport system substrate-binding protein
MKYKSKVIVASTLILICLSSSYFVSSKIVCLRDSDSLAYLVLKTNPGEHFDYAVNIANYLRQIGVNVRIQVEECGFFDNLLVTSTNYDLAIIEIRQQKGYGTSNIRTIFTEDGSLNVFGLETEFPYVNQSEQMLQKIYSTQDSRIIEETYFDWTRLLMDKILPALPLYFPRSYCVHWINIQNHDSRWGIGNSLPYIFMENLHKGQNSKHELNLYDSSKSTFNPLIDERFNHYWLVNSEENRSFDSLKLSLITEPIHLWSPDYAPLKNGVIQDWEIIDDDHYKFYLRDDVYWNPSYNVTERNEDSQPLNTIDTSDLMEGLKYGEYSNGSNHKVTAKDAVFSLLTYANPLISELYDSFNWIKDIKIDDNNTLAFHIFRNNQIIFPEMEYPILPEFFLNSTDTALSYSSGGVKTWGLYEGIEKTPQWETYWLSPFGCGKYMIDYYKGNGIISYEKSPYWFGVGYDGSINLELNIERINVNSHLNKQEAVNEFLEGKIDILNFNKNLELLKRIWGDSRFLIQNYLPRSMIYLVFNLKRPFIGHADNYHFIESPGKEEYTKGVAVRKAISYAIDRKKMNMELNNGGYWITDYPLLYFPGCYYGSDWEDCYIFQYNHSIDEAFVWLDAAGWATFICNNVSAFNFFYTMIVFIFIGSTVVKKKRKRSSA